MAEFDNSSPTAKLFTPRNLILAAALVLLLSVIGSSLSMLRPNDSGGLGRDSYGVTAVGYRALLETLESLGVRVERSLGPPSPQRGTPQTMVFNRPNPMLVAHSPRYLDVLLEWVEQGGRLVVAPADWEHHWANRQSSVSPEIPLEHDILKLLGVDEQVRLEKYVSELDSAADATAGAQARANGADEEEESWPDEIRELWSDAAPETVVRPTRMTGSFAPLANSVRELAVPKLEYLRLVGKPDELSGTISVDDGPDQRPLLVVAVTRGKGEIVIVSDPRLLANALLAKADNSVLAVNLLAPHGETVVLDEFYHGLSVRGNALYLFTRPGYAAVAVGLLLGVAVTSWRKGVFLGPPLPDLGPARRDIGQYVDAMADFFARGPDHRRFLMREMRDGALQQVCQELALPPDTANTDAILTVLERRSPARAEELRRILPKIEAALAARGDVPKSIYLPLLQRLASCL